MPTAVILLRGINLGPSNRIAMGALREALSAAGYARVRHPDDITHSKLAVAITPKHASASPRTDP